MSDETYFVALLTREHNSISASVGPSSPPAWHLWFQHSLGRFSAFLEGHRQRYLFETYSNLT